MWTVERDISDLSGDLVVMVKVELEDLKLVVRLFVSLRLPGTVYQSAVMNSMRSQSYHTLHN